jgi:hypothetical protein
MQRYIWLLAVSLVSPGSDGRITSQTLRREPPVQIFATLGLTPEQVSTVDAGRPVAKVLSLKGSQQDGLTGVRGSLLRKAVVDRTRTSLERALASIKQTVEHSAAGG